VPEFEVNEAMKSVIGKFRILQLPEFGGCSFVDLSDTSDIEFPRLRGAHLQIWLTLNNELFHVKQFGCAEVGGGLRTPTRHQPPPVIPDARSAIRNLPELRRLPPGPGYSLTRIPG
jgi:hypothetical protein